MRKSIAPMIAAFLAVGAFLMPSRSDALPIGSAASDIRLTVDGLNLIEKTQFVYLGRRYCFYPVGWHGPGWYRCGYAWRRGYGWGGVYGWRGWRHPRYHTRFVVRPRPGVRSRTVIRSRPGVRSRTVIRSRPGVRSRTTVRSRPGVRSRTTVRSRPGVRSRTTVRSRTKRNR